MTALSFVQRTGTVMATASLALGGANEICQRLVQRGVLDYQIAFGYISDLCAVPFTTGLAVAITGKWTWYFPVGYAILFSLLELEGVLDPLDFLAYWSSAALVLGIFKWSQQRDSTS